MTPGSYSFTITRGVSWPGLRLTLQDGDSPVDLTGCTLEVQARRGPGKPLAFELSTALVDATSGIASLTALGHAQTSALPLGEWRYDLVIVEPDGTRTGPWISGRISVVDAITQPD